MGYWVQFLLVFIAMALADVCWTFYFIKIEERKAIASGIWGSILVALGAFSIDSYTDDKTFIIAAVFGAFVGTYLVVSNKKHKERKKPNEYKREDI